MALQKELERLKQFLMAPRDYEHGHLEKHETSACSPSFHKRWLALSARELSILVNFSSLNGSLILGRHSESVVVIREGIK